MTRRSIEQELDAIKADGLYRSTREASRGGARIELQGRSVANFSSNDYLDLANDERLKAAAREATQKFGTGAAASPLMSGRLSLHADLEFDVSRWIETESAILFGSGFLANVGTVSSLVGRGDLIVADRRVHASLIDGAQLSRATFIRYAHNDPDSLEQILAERAEKHRRVLVMTESVFSMDGDIAPLAAVADAARRYDALLLVDEAHAIGVIGPRGRGVAACLPDYLKPDLLVGTFGKALGGYGAFVACSTTLRDYLVNRARSYIYSTASPPATLAAAREAVRIINQQPQEWSLSEQFRDRVAMLEQMLNNAGFETPGHRTPIIPVMIGENNAATEAAEHLLKDDVLAVAVRPPTVPEGTARLRLSVTMGHTDQDFEQLVAALIRWRDATSGALDIAKRSE